MYYELYIDVLFMINIMMDFFLLLLVKKITKCSTTNLRIAGASFTGALLTCFTIVFSVTYFHLASIVVQIVVSIIIVRIGFKWINLATFLKCLLSLYLGGILLAGVVQYFQQYLKVGSLFFFLSFLSYFIVKKLWDFISYLNRFHSKWYDVELYLGDECIKLKALLDTGNSLVDPYSGKPVSIVTKSSVEHILKNDLDDLQLNTPRYIPYHALGKEGVLLTIKANKLHICGEKDWWIENLRIGISDNYLTKNNCYQMILNPDII